MAALKVTFFDDIEGQDPAEREDGVVAAPSNSNRDVETPMGDNREGVSRNSVGAASSNLDLALGESEVGDSASSVSELDFVIADSTNRDDQPESGSKLPRGRVAGGWSAVPKRVTNDLDSDDELLIHMKTHGYNDRQITTRFVQDGRIRYNKKTITSRYRRVMATLETAMDKALESQHVQWKANHDQALLQAFETSNEEIEMEIERLRSRRWQTVCTNLRAIIPESRYSADACQKRYIDLVNGVAMIPIELDDDPQEREREQLLRIQASLTSRQEADEAERKAREEKAVSLHLAKLEREKKKQTAEDKRAQKLREQALAAEKRAAEKLAHLHASLKRSSAGQSGSPKRQKKDNSTENEASPGAASTQASPYHAPTSSVDDPRSRLNMAQLLRLSEKRSVRTIGATKDQLVERLRNYDAKFSNKELQDRLRDLNRPVNGAKAVLLYRLADIDYRYYNDHYGEFDHPSDKEDEVQYDGGEDASELALLNEVFSARDA